MTFVNLSLLAGAAMIAVPIVLHLIMRQQPRRVEFPALRFIQKQHDVNQRRLRLRHLLLLLLRMLAIAFLAFALARPSMKLSGGALGSQEAPVAAAMLFDTAPRMGYRQDNQTRLEAAQEMGLWLLAQLPRESQFAVLDARPGPAAFQADRGAAVERIERLEPAADAQPMPVALEEALRLLQKSGLSRKEVYLFTDLSRGGWPEGANNVLRQRMSELPDVTFYVIDVGATEPSNSALGELRLSGEVLSNRSPLSLGVEVSRRGTVDQRSVELYLLDSERNPQKRSEQSISLGPGESQEIVFRLGSLEVGTHQGLVRIVGQDGLAADDVRYFTVEVRPAWRVLIAAPEPADRYAVYLGESLAPETFRQRGQARYDCRVVSLEALASQSLEGFAAVFVLDPTPQPPAVWKKLRDYAADGHGVAVFLGRNAMPIDSFHHPLAQEVLAGKPLRQARAPAGDVALAPTDYQHPILRVFREHAGSVPWDAFPVFRYWQLSEPAEGVGVVLPYSDGRPAILERPVGTGRVLTMTTPISDRPNQDAWNLLPVGEAWPFVILANETASYLVGSAEQQLNYLAGQPAMIHLDGDQKRRTFLLTAPGDLQFSLTADLKQNVLVVTSTDQAGNYRLQAGGRAEGVERGFSVNLAMDQTRLDRVNEQQLGKFFEPRDYRLARTTEQLERDVSTARVGRELFPSLIVIVALLLGMEYVLANRFYRKQ